MEFTALPGREARGLRLISPEDSRVAFRLARLAADETALAVPFPERSEESPGGWEIRRSGGLREWYRQSEDGGVEHGFTIEQPPTGALATSTLTLALAVDSPLTLAEVGENDVHFRDGEGRSVWRYHGLVVRDAAGLELPSRMMLESGRRGRAPELRLVADVSHATYPVEVDPLFVSAEVKAFTPPSVVNNRSEDAEETYAVAGEWVVFFARDPAYGRELWRTHRVTGATEMLRDINPGPAGCSPTRQAVLDGVSYFGALDASNGYQLWRTDGTPDGTYPLKAFPSSSANKPTVRFALTVGSRVYFEVASFDSGVSQDVTGLWRTDGTTAGTGRLFAQSAAFPGLQYAAAVGDVIVGEGSTTANGTEPWRTDGTAAGTSLLADVIPGSGASTPRGFATVGPNVFFTPFNSQQLWVTDATTAGTRLLSSKAGATMTPLGDWMIFTEFDPANGAASVRRSNGTVTESIRTVIVNFDAKLQVLGSDGSRAYFTVTTSAERALWRTDGSSAGTIKLRAFGTQGETSVDSWASVGGNFFFAAMTAANGRELWKTDGTVAGTAIVKETMPGALSSNAKVVLADAPWLYFLAISPTEGWELWRTDGTAAGTQFMRDVYKDSSDQRPGGLVATGGQLFFSAHTPALGRELWKTDGTAAGTLLVKDVIAGATGGFVDRQRDQFIGVNGQLFCTPWQTGLGNVLLRSDGTEVGTAILKSPVVLPGLTGTDTHYVTALPTKLLFPVTAAAEAGLWASDGTVAGTRRLAAGGEGVTRLGDIAVFAGRNAAGDPTLWRTDGTSTGTVSIAPAGVTMERPGYLPLKTANGLAFFVGIDATRGQELWTTDGTRAGTRIVSDLTAGTGSSFIYQLGTVAGKFVFFRTVGSSAEMWVTNGTAAGTTKLSSNATAGIALARANQTSDALLYYLANRDIWRTNGTAAGTFKIVSYPASNNFLDLPTGFTDVNERTVFVADTDASGQEAWVTDGTAAGTKMLLNIMPGSVSAEAEIIGQARGRVFFAAADAARGRELWSTDGTPEGTALVEDLNPGYASSSPFWLGEVNGRVLVLYDDYPKLMAYSMRELVITPLPELQTGSATGVTVEGATVAGDLAPDAAVGTYYFEYGPTSAYGSSTVPAMPPAGQIVSVQAPLTGLTGATSYHYRLVFKVGEAVYTGQDRTFDTLVWEMTKGASGTGTPISNGLTSPVSSLTLAEDTTGTHLFTIRNAGASVLTVETVTVPAGYVVRGPAFPREIAPGTAALLEIEVQPTLPGTLAGSVAVATSGGNLTFPVSTTATPVNDAPTLTELADQTIIAGTALPPLAVTLADEDTPLASLVFSLTSSDPLRLPPSSWIVSGTGGNRSVRLTAPLGPSATVTLTARVSDGQASAQRTFNVRIIEDVVSVRLTEAGSIALRFTGLPGRSYTLQWSDDCATWHDGEAHVASEEGEILSTDEPSVSGARYYRLRSVP